jgi:GNAT superfamily N-acetyltransferase
MSTIDSVVSAARAHSVAVGAVETISPDFAGRIASVTRSAYRGGDAVPGLPVADGARETAGEVLADVAAGIRLWGATVDGACAGSVRAAPVSPGTWEVRRLAVAPWAGGTGLARRLMTALEDGARAAGATEIALNAVVERGTPAFYSRAGYRTVTHFGATDKPLSEVRMVRDLRTEAEALAYPLSGEDTPPVPGVVVTWWSVPGGTACRVTENFAVAAVAADGDFLGGEARLLGADCWPGAGRDELESVRAALSGSSDRTGATLGFDRPAPAVAAFVQPRLVRPELLAWWRTPSVSHGRGR